MFKKGTVFLLCALMLFPAGITDAWAIDTGSETVTETEEEQANDSRSEDTGAGETDPELVTPLWEGDGTGDNPYRIKNDTDFTALMEAVQTNDTSVDPTMKSEQMSTSGGAVQKRYHFIGVHFKLDTSDISLDETFTGIGDTTHVFSGVFDGDGNTITVEIDDPTNDPSATYSFFGLFNNVDAWNVGDAPQAVIKNLNVTGTIKRFPSTALGAVVAILFDGRVENCTFNGDIEALSNAGGIVGEAVGSTLHSAVISGCTVNGSVTGQANGNHIGGVLGYAFQNAMVTGCENHAAVTSLAPTGTGGIVGRCFDGSLITDCKNLGKVTSNGAAGGIAGNVTSHNSATGNTYGLLKAPASVENCENSAEVTSRGQSGAIAGSVEIGGSVSGCTNKSDSAKNIVGAYSIHMVLYDGTERMAVEESTGIGDFGKPLVQLYKDGKVAEVLYAFNTAADSADYPGPFHRLVRANASTGDMYKNLFKPCAAGEYSIYIDERDSGFKINSSSEVINIQTLLSADPSTLNILRANVTPDAKLNVTIPEGIGLTGISVDGEALKSSDYTDAVDDTNKAAHIITLPSSFTSGLETGAHTLSINTAMAKGEEDEEVVFVPLTVPIEVVQGPVATADYSVFDKRTSGSNYRDITFTFSFLNEGAKLTKVNVSGNDVGTGNYTYDESKQTCVLSRSFLAGLATGTANVKFDFSNSSSVETELTIMLSEEPPEEPSKPSKPSGSSKPYGSSSSSGSYSKPETVTVNSSTPSVQQISTAISQSTGDVTVKGNDTASLYKASFNALKNNDRGMKVKLENGTIELSPEVCAAIEAKLKDTDFFVAEIKDNKAVISIGTEVIELPMDGNTLQITALPVPDTTLSGNTAIISGTVAGDTATAEVSADMGSDIVSQAKKDNLSNIIIAPKNTGDVTYTEVSIPAETVTGLGSETNAALTVSTSVADVTIPNRALSGLDVQNGSIKVSAENKDGTVEIKVKAGDKTVKKLDGGLNVTVPQTNVTAGTVAVLIKEDGTREVIRKSVASGNSIKIPLDGSAKFEIVDNSKSFSDVPSGNWAYDSVAFASGHELFNGTSETAFSPDEPMTRGMLVTVLARLEGADMATSTGSKWYEPGMDWAVRQGISDGSNPEGRITREQLATMLHRYKGSPEVSGNSSLDFPDAAEVSGYADKAVRWAVDTGMISGMGDGTLNPKGDATRAQVATIFMRMLMLSDDAEEPEANK